MAAAPRNRPTGDKSSRQGAWSARTEYHSELPEGSGLCKELMTGASDFNSSTSLGESRTCPV